MHISVFRKDPKNVGDWWSRPATYLPLKAQENADLVAEEPIPNEPGIVILGGGGLGREAFEPYLKRLARPDRKYTIIAWGVGADSVTRKKQLMPGPEDMAALTAYFDDMDEIGTRIHSSDNYGGDARYRWVPCASCLSPLFQELRGRPAKRRIGIYEHLREPLTPHIGQGGRLWAKWFGRYDIASNRGMDLEAKLTFLADSEYVLTNSYHGVFWGTILGRKVICAPFKNGLFSFRHMPTYLGANGLDAALDQARAYPEALEECQAANHAFHDDMRAKYGEL